MGEELVLEKFVKRYIENHKLFPIENNKRISIAQWQLFASAIHMNIDDFLEKVYVAHVTRQLIRIHFDVNLKKIDEWIKTNLLSHQFTSAPHDLPKICKFLNMPCGDDDIFTLADRIVLKLEEDKKKREMEEAITLKLEEEKPRTKKRKQ